MENPNHTFVEVCGGCGGLSQGFMNAGLRPLLLNEINPTCCKTLRLNHPEVVVQEGDMTHLLPILTELGEPPDILMGGVPCQSFSQAGKRQGLEDSRGQLMFRFNELVKGLRPKMFILENVRGLLTHNAGETFKTLKVLLENNGDYNVVFNILNAVNYGVPQKRERVFIVGIRKDLPFGEFMFPEPVPLGERKVLRDVLQNVPKSQGAVYNEKKLKVMEQVPPGGCWINLSPECQLEYMGAKMLASGGGKRGVARRMNMDEPSLTLTTSPCQKQTERCHPIETRPFNVREYARIQTFPDDYQFAGSMLQQYRQIGNAVPVLLATQVGTSVRAFLSNHQTS